MPNMPGAALPLFQIGEGVRRSLAAKQMGKTQIAARELKPDGSIVDLGAVTLTSLYVDLNKSSVVMDQRWLGVFKAVGTGVAPPIEVIAITAEKAKVLLPLALVTMKRP